MFFVFIKGNYCVSYAQLVFALLNVVAGPYVTHMNMGSECKQFNFELYWWLTGIHGWDGEHINGGAFTPPKLLK